MPDTLGLLIDLENMNWLQLTALGAIAYLFVLWVALVVWVARDCVNRTRSIALQVLAILLVAVLNVFGLVLYLILRPQRTLLERYYEEMELKAFRKLEAEGALQKPKHPPHPPHKKKEKEVK